MIIRLVGNRLIKSYFPVVNLIELVLQFKIQNLMELNPNLFV